MTASPQCVVVLTVVRPTRLSDPPRDEVTWPEMRLKIIGPVDRLAATAMFVALCSRQPVREGRLRVKVVPVAGRDTYHDVYDVDGAFWAAPLMTPAVREHLRRLATPPVLPAGRHAADRTELPVAGGSPDGPQDRDLPVAGRRPTRAL